MIKKVSIYPLLFVFLLNGCSPTLQSFKVLNASISGNYSTKNPKHEGSYDYQKDNDLFYKGNLDSKHRTCFDVKKYTLNIFPNSQKKILSGSTIIEAIAENNFDTLQLDLNSNLLLTSLKFNNKNVNYYRHNDAILVLPGNVTKGDQFIIEGSFEGKPIQAKYPPWEGGLVWGHDINNKDWVGVACETEGASLWWLCKDVTNDEPDEIFVNITSKNDLMAISNGQYLGFSENKESNTKIHHWHTSYPVNPYNVTFYLGNYVAIKDSFKSINESWIPINHWVLAYNYKKAKKHFVQAKKYIEFYEKTFGEFPWQKDGYNLIESPYAGMEHQSAIAYGNSYKNFPYNFDYIILHETAHEWWGNAVTAKDLGDGGWIQEGFATYCEFLFVEKTESKKIFENYIGVTKLRLHNLRPISRPKNIRYFNYKDEDIYFKGAWMLHTLRNTIKNDTLFFNILKQFYVQQKLNPIGTTSKDFETIINVMTGKDYNWFFQQYIHSRFVPVLEYSYNKNTLNYKWSFCNESFDLPIKIEINNQKIELKPNSTLQTFTFNEKIKNVKFQSRIKLLYETSRY